MAPRRMETKPLIFCLKTLLLLYSFIFWVTGVVLLSVGLWWKFMLGPYTLLISSGPSNAPLILSGTGAAIVLFGLFGCFAACRGRPWMLRLVGLSLFLGSASCQHSDEMLLVVLHQSVLC
uniref:Tetraspanin 7 n=1 Tax=Acanthochromis polyacanthus TaxID=80966 RepID=A0A3Q1F0W9_9TELE